MDRFRGQLTGAVAEVEGVQVQLCEMIGHVQRLLPMFGDVQASFDGQDQGVPQINDALVALGAKVDATSRALEQAGANRRQVEETGRLLQTLVSQMEAGDA